MHEISIDLCSNVMAENQKIADSNSQLFASKNLRSYDLFGPVGSGKTLLIESISELLEGRGLSCGVIAGDVAGDADYQRFRSRGLPVVNLNTGKECHLDAHMAEHALEHLDLDALDILFIENVGNIICPADFPLGTDLRLLVLSVTEGDDMVKKHPMVFLCVDIVVINKMDLAGIMEVSLEALRDDVAEVNPRARTFFTDAKHGEGLDELVEALGL